MNEFLMNRVTYSSLSDELKENATILLMKVNELLKLFGEYRQCNSGYRTPEDQQRINPKSTTSKHLTCQAIDIADKDKKLANWCHKNEYLLAKYELYCEDTNSTSTWVHFQIVPPKSGKRFFIP